VLGGARNGLAGRQPNGKNPGKYQGQSAAPPVIANPHNHLLLS
jgi:hypothetical protein